MAHNPFDSDAAVPLSHSDAVLAHRLRLKISLALAAAPLGYMLPAWAQPSAAADYPTKPVRWIVPTSPGGGTDATGRAFAQIASDTLHQSMVVDNRSGASGMIGLDVAAAAPPDGYTLCFMSVSQFLDGTLANRYTFDARKDFTPISLLATTPLILLANPAVNVSSLQELIARARKEPGALNYSSGGAGGITHFAMESFLKKAGIQLTHVPYKGSGPAVADLLAGHVQFTFSTPAAVLQYVKAGKLRAIAVASDAPSPLAPGVPTFAQGGLPGVNLGVWYGLFGPARMPTELVQKVAEAITSAGKQAAVHDKLVRDGVEPILGTPAEFTRFLDGEREQWATVARTIGFKREN